VRVAHPGVHDDEGEAGALEAEIDDLGVEGAAVEEDGRVGLAEQRRRLVHDAGRGADGDVLGELADAGERFAVEFELPDIVEREGDGTLDRGRRRQARADGHVRIDVEVDARHRREVGAVLAERPRDAERVGRPAAEGDGSRSARGISATSSAKALATRITRSSRRPRATTVRRLIAKGSTKPSL
jgi:hypothetical protein